MTEPIYSFDPEQWKKAIEEKPMRAVLRPAVPEDRSPIMSFWLKGVYWGSDYFNQMPQDLFFQLYAEHIKRILFSPLTKVDVACEEGNPDQIFGYACYAEQTLHWVYVKKGYRNKGIARLLLKDKNIDTATSMTKAGRAIMKKHNVVFNPFI
jgi:GNAT superfamily N-acetyltransferase